jgi:Ca2+-binding RTX toxin-like protein
MRSIGRVFATGTVAVAGLLAVAAPASGAVTCAYDQAAEVLTATANANGDLVLLGVAGGGEIQVIDGVANQVVGCSGAGGPPRVSNTSNINLGDTNVSTSWFVANPEDLVPGTGGSGEVETLAALGGGNDGVSFFDGNESDDFWILGASGLNWNPNADMDADASFISVEQVGLVGNDGNDAITAQGTAGTGAPFAGPGTFVGSGGGDNDVIEGGGTSDVLLAGFGNDTLRGFGGADELASDHGTNQLVGGTGDDRASYLNSTVGVSVDLGVAGPQDTGIGIDTLSAVEGLEGTNEADVLSGNGDANALVGHDGDDTLDGRGGNDPLQGGAGVDTATYESAPAGVSVDLDAGTATGGADNDILAGIDDLIGSPFADTLIGDAANNSIIGLGGNDTVRAEGGADDVRVRDGGPDTASCGTEIDTAVADRASVDSVNPDCETVDFLPEDGDGGGGGVGGPSNEFSFGKVKRNERKGTAKLTVEVPRPGELELAKTNKVKADDELAEAEGDEKLKIKPKGKARKRLAKKGKAKVKAEVTYTPTGGEPNTKTKKLKLKLR